MKMLWLNNCLHFVIKYTRTGLILFEPDSMEYSQYIERFLLNERCFLTSSRCIRSSNYVVFGLACLLCSLSGIRPK